MVLLGEIDHLRIIQQHPRAMVRFLFGIGFIGISLYIIFGLKTGTYVLPILILFPSILIAFLQRVHVIIVMKLQ